MGKVEEAEIVVVAGRAVRITHPDKRSDVRRVTLEMRALLEEVRLVGWPKTSGSQQTPDPDHDPTREWRERNGSSRG